MPHYTPAGEPRIFKTSRPFEDYFVEGFIVHVDRESGEITGQTDLLHDGPPTAGGKGVEMDLIEWDGGE